MSYQPKVALVHDDFIQNGGAENLFAQVAQIWPKAPIYTSLSDPKKLPAEIDPKRIRTSFLQKIPLSQKFYKALLPLYPLAFESFNLQKYDLVISSTTRFANSIVTGPNTVHVCYINSVPRFLWKKKTKKNYQVKYLSVLLNPLLGYLKKWDKVSSERVDFFIANSQNVKNMVEKYYGKKAEVVYPFADLDFYKSSKTNKRQDYYLIVSRLVKWKKIDIAVNSAKKSNIKLKIVGEGPDKKRLQKLGKGANIEFLGWVEKEKLRTLYQNCRALIVPQEEDFGIASVEAQACGTPVIAYAKGGQIEIIKPGKTGIFFEKQTAQCLLDAISDSFNVKWSHASARKQAERFSKDTFTAALKSKIDLYARKS